MESDDLLLLGSRLREEERIEERERERESSRNQESGSDSQSQLIRNEDRDALLSFSFHWSPLVRIRDNDSDCFTGVKASSIARQHNNCATLTHIHAHTRLTPSS